jgi:hypothetical protein
MLQEILKECELADEYLQAMKKTMLNDKGDCDNVRMHIAKIKGKVNTLLIADVVGRSEQLKCERCGKVFIPHLMKPLTICDKCADSIAL